MKIERTRKVLPPSHPSRADREAHGAPHPPGDERYLWESLVPRLLHPAQLAIIEALRISGRPLWEGDFADLIQPDRALTWGSLDHQLRCMARVGVLVVIQCRDRPSGNGEEARYDLAPGVPSPSTTPV